VANQAACLKGFSGLKAKLRWKSHLLAEGVNPLDLLYMPPVA
jgi:hypothetical protein